MNNKIAERLRTERLTPELLRDAINELDMLWSLVERIPTVDLITFAADVIANDPSRGRLRSEEAR